MLNLHTNISGFMNVTEPHSPSCCLYPQSCQMCSTVSRLAGMDQAVHKLNVGHYTLDVKVSQLIERLSRVDGKTITFSHKSSFLHRPFYSPFHQLYNLSCIL